jgi:hypothetical protein
VFDLLKNNLFAMSHYTLQPEKSPHEIIAICDLKRQEWIPNKRRGIKHRFATSSLIYGRLRHQCRKATRMRNQDPDQGYVRVLAMEIYLRTIHDMQEQWNS